MNGVEAQRGGERDGEKEGGRRMTLRRAPSINSSVMTPPDEEKNNAAARPDAVDDSDRKQVAVKLANRRAADLTVLCPHR